VYKETGAPPSVVGGRQVVGEAGGVELPRRGEGEAEAEAGGWRGRKEARAWGRARGRRRSWSHIRVARV
jgi:hypothetical protein